MSWEPPSQPNGPIYDYSVYLAIKRTAGNTQEMTSKTKGADVSKSSSSKLSCHAQFLDLNLGIAPILSGAHPAI